MKNFERPKATERRATCLENRNSIRSEVTTRGWLSCDDDTKHLAFCWTASARAPVHYINSGNDYPLELMEQRTIALHLK
jgi:hypothetical protein